MNVTSGLIGTSSRSHTVDISGLDGMLTPEDWTRDALCSQIPPDAWFPPVGDPGRDAKRVCGSCDVREQCLDYALRNNERFGIWGGLSEMERRQLRRAS